MSTAFDGLGRALRWIRDKQSKKQYQVAEDAGVTKAMLSAYETGKQKPSIETLEKILDALKVDLADLFNALEVVNERPPMGRPFHRSAGAWGAQPPPDVYQVLGIERPLAREEEAAMAEMLNGFHRLLRYFHHVIASGQLPETAGGDEDGDGEDEGDEGGEGGGGGDAPVKG